MKMRNGFVSNSSSSSFVLGKVYMTEDQIKKLSQFIDENTCPSWDEEKEYNDYFSEDTYISDLGFYFHGDIEYSDLEKMIKFLDEIGVDIKYAILET